MGQPRYPVMHYLIYFLVTALMLVGGLFWASANMEATPLFDVEHRDYTIHVTTANYSPPERQAVTLDLSASPEKRVAR